jgi:hypothetical protein
MSESAPRRGSKTQPQFRIIDDDELDHACEIIHDFLRSDNTMQARDVALQIDAVIPESHRNRVNAPDDNTVAGFLRGFWKEFIAIVTQTPAESSQHDRLLELALGLYDLPMIENTVY